MQTILISDEEAKEVLFSIDYKPDAFVQEGINEIASYLQ